MSIIFNGAGYVEFPALNITLDDNTGWTLLIKATYQGNAGTDRETLFHHGNQSAIKNVLTLHVGNASIGDSWEANRLVYRMVNDQSTTRSFESPAGSFNFASADDAVFFIRKQAGTVRFGRCMKSGNVEAVNDAMAAGTQLFNSIIRLGSNQWDQRYLKTGREIHEFGIISRALTDAEIQQYVNGTGFASIAGADMQAYAPLNEGIGTSTTLQKAGGTTVTGTLSGGLTWGATASVPVVFNGTVPTQNATQNAAATINLSTFFSGNLTPFTYSLVAGSLSGTGLSLNPSTGAISGTPSAVGAISGLQVRATDTSNNTATTNVFSINVAAPALPAGTVTVGSITSGQTTATVPFTYSASDQSGFEYRIDTGAPITVSGGVSPISLTGLSGSTTYSVQVRAVNATGAGAWSSAVSFTTQAVPQVPQGSFSFGTLEISSNQVVIPYTYSLSDWTSIQYQVNGGTARAATVSPQTITGLNPSTAYSVQFRAVNANGNGAWSTAVNFSTTATVNGTITLSDLVNNAGQPLASTSNVTVDVYSPATGGLVTRKTALTTTAGADLSVSDAAIVAGNTYNVVITIGAAIGVAKVLAV